MIAHTHFTIVGIAFLALVVAPPARSDPFESLPDGSLRHPSSRFVFPQRIGDFLRTEAQKYDRDGLDVSAGYDVLSIAATVYAYPAPHDPGDGALEKEYQSRRAEVIAGHQNVSVTSEDKLTLKQEGLNRSGRHAVFTFSDVFRNTPSELESQLLLFRCGTVFVEYRFTYPRSEASKARKQVEAFVRSWAWRGTDG